MSNSRDFMPPDIEDEVQERADDSKRRREARMALAAASALAETPNTWAGRRTMNPGATGGRRATQAPENKSKRRAKGKAQRQARRKNRSRS